MKSKMRAGEVHLLEGQGLMEEGWSILKTTVEICLYLLSIENLNISRLVGFWSYLLLLYSVVHIFPQYLACQTTLFLILRNVLSMNKTESALCSWLLLKPLLTSLARPSIPWIPLVKVRGVQILVWAGRPNQKIKFSTWLNTFRSSLRSKHLKKNRSWSNLVQSWFWTEDRKCDWIIL